jgi:hypothetical protein
MSQSWILNETHIAGEGKTMPHNSKIAVWVIFFSLLILFSCSKSDNGTGSGDNPFVDIATVFNGTSIQVYSVKMDWSPDGSFIVFAAGPSGNIWKVRAQENSTPVSVSDTSSAGDYDGGYTPSYMSDGWIAYYLGWLHSDQLMHIMAAPENQVKNSPHPTVLRTFNGPDVGLSQYSAASPNELSVSGDGVRAVGSWGNSVYTLDWSTGQCMSADISNQVGAAFSLMISRDGSKIAYQTESQIKWIPFQGGAATVVGAGIYPSWNGDGILLGYLDGTGKSYKVHDFKTGTTKSYDIFYSGTLQYPVLSWDGRNIAFRRFGTVDSGILIGALVE